MSFVAGAQVQQKPAHYDEIQAFRKKDSISKPVPGQILFVGSSSFRLWKTLQKDFPGYPIINRGFGGSTLMDLIHYHREVVVPYKPKQIIIYCGENDLASSDTVSADNVLKRFEIFYFLVRKYYPKIPLVYISIKPSPSRKHLMPKMVEANELIKDFLKKRNHNRFVDVYHLMLTENGEPRAELFGDDKLHMNAAGYEIWQKALLPVLVKTAYHPPKIKKTRTVNR